MKNDTPETIAKVIRGLRAGKSPKVIAWEMQAGWECVKSVINRHPQVRQVYVETHKLRYPHKEAPPLKIVSPLREFAT